MKRVVKTAGAVVMATFTLMFAAACSKQETTSQAGTGLAEITFKSNPEMLKMGDNSFEVMVMQDGKPVDDAQVSVEFFMAAMPQMNMKEMRTKTDLMAMGNGMYQGKGQVITAGNWDVTVMAIKSGREIGSRKLAVTAK